MPTRQRGGSAANQDTGSATSRAAADNDRRTAHRPPDACRLLPLLDQTTSKHRISWLSYESTFRQRL